MKFKINGLPSMTQWLLLPTSGIICHLWSISWSMLAVFGPVLPNHKTHIPLSQNLKVEEQKRFVFMEILILVVVVEAPMVLIIPLQAP